MANARTNSNSNSSTEDTTDETTTAIEPTQPEHLAINDEDGEVEVTLVKNTPVGVLTNDPPAKMKRPGGARAERGTKVTVSAERANFLRKHGYASAK